MSFRLEMLQAARLATRTLGESAALVVDFYQAQVDPTTGAIRDRQGKPDLYYTVFGIEGLLALQQPAHTAALADWLRSHGSGEGLDFVHLCCLARCDAALGRTILSPDQRQALAARLAAHSCKQGGHHVAKGREWGSAYGCLLAVAAHEDLGIPLPDAAGLRDCMEKLRTPDGAWTNEPGLPLGLAPATAAALGLYRRMDWPAPAESVHWLRKCFTSEGGCKAFPAAPMPDLLSTAVVLHALSGAGADLDPLREPCLDYVDSLWSNAGGFHGNWTDHTLDAEYTYYGLLALGPLSV
jgi:prenyltransferase beta subunit